MQPTLVAIAVTLRRDVSAFGAFVYTVEVGRCLCLRAATDQLTLLGEITYDVASASSGHFQEEFSVIGIWPRYLWDSSSKLPEVRLEHAHCSAVIL